MVGPYTCDTCRWQYVWTMGDRIKAVKWHQLAHLVEGRDTAENTDQPSWGLSENVELIAQNAWRSSVQSAV